MPGVNVVGDHAPFRLRSLEPGDGPAIAALLAASPDTGTVRMRLEYKIDPYVAFTYGGHDLGVVVESDRVEGLAGMGMVRLGEAMIRGERRPLGFLYALMVHPACRRQGMARAIAERRVALATERLGADAVIMATIQQGNTGSFANARAWSSQLSRPLIMLPMPMRKSPPSGAAAGRVRPAGPKDLAAFAGGSNDFHDHFDLWSPADEESLAGWLAASPVSDPVRKLWVIEDAAGNLLAGLGTSESRRVSTEYIDHMPVGMRALNLVLRIVPRSGSVDYPAVSKLWFKSGNESAARTLFETVRWEMRTLGEGVACTFDPEGPTARMVRRSRLQMTGRMRLAIRSQAEIRPDWFLDPSE